MAGRPRKQQQQTSVDKSQIVEKENSDEMMETDIGKSTNFMFNNVNRENSICAVSVSMIHQEISQFSSQFQIDGCPLELVRIAGKVSNTPRIDAERVVFLLNDIEKSSQSLTPILCNMWKINVDGYEKNIQLLKKPKICVVGSLDYDGTQMILNVSSVKLLNSDLDVKYHSLEIQLHSVRRQFLKKELQHAATAISTLFNNPADMKG
jgi:hypothetical protein